MCGLYKKEVLMEISVVIPVYNKEQFVEQCLEKTLSMEFESYEVIPVDE
ncbi:MAG: glycosyltransferase, partial [Prevotella sp.]|nr:glycosyltransferase [Prevotella sp.]